MINIETLKNKLKKMTMRRHAPDRRLMHPNREWGIGLLMLVCILVVGGVYATYVFNQYNDIDVNTENVEVETVHYNRADALKAIEIYNEKQSAYDALITDRPVATTENENTIEEDIEGSTNLETDVSSGDEPTEGTENAQDDVSSTEVPVVDEEVQL